ncbi:MAG: polysaccharide deacetylase family protein [Acidobacteriota bacterium]
MIKTLEPVASSCSESPSLRLRFIASIKDLLFFIYLYCGYVQLRDLILSLVGRSRAVVLYYHRIGQADVLTTSAEEFHHQLRYFKNRYECISLAELCHRLREGRPLRRRSLVITFDDGYRDNFTFAAPLLKASGLTATFFVSTGFIESGRDFPHDLRDHQASGRFPKLTWDDLRQMETAGFEIGSHTINHISLGRADSVTVEQEVYDSLAALTRELGRRERPFSFPWGKPEDISAEAMDCVRRAGYYAAVSAYGGANTRGDEVFGIRRVDVGNGKMSRLAVRARVAGFDPDYLRLKIRNLKSQISNLKSQIS